MSATERSLAGKTLIMSGGSRGIGLAIAKRAAADGANVALIAKTAEPDPRLQGTIFTAAEQIEAAGGRALPIVGDVRDAEQIEAAVASTVGTFGAIDVCINNASAIAPLPSLDLTPKRYDLMQDVNTRGTYFLTRACIPHLLKADNPHVLTLSPPLNLNPDWFATHLGYTISKYGMSMCTLGFAREFEAEGIAANSLWPRTLIATDAVRNIMGGDEAMAKARSPQIMSDAAREIVTRDSRSVTGRFFIDDEVMREAGVEDFSVYGADEADLGLDIFVDAPMDAGTA